MAVIGQADAALVPARAASPDARRNGHRLTREDVVWGACAVLTALGLALWMRGFTIDDALISVRYARHLAAGEGYRFNAGGPSTDGVTPLTWPFLLAPFASGSALVVLARAKLVGLLAWLVAAAVWGVAVGRAPARREAKLSAFLLLGLCVPVAAHAVSGMETGLAIALVTVAAIATNPWACAAIAGAAATVRPELVVWSVVLAVGVGPIRRAVPRVLLAAGPFILVAVIRFATFGRAAPLALLAKPSDLSHGLVYGAAASLVSLGPIILIAPLALIRAHDRSTAIAVAGLAHFGAIVTVGGDWMPYARLAAPIVPSLLYAFVLASPRMSRAFAALRLGVAGAIAIYVLVRAAPAGRHVDAHVTALVDAARAPLAGAHRIAALDVGWPTAASEATIVDLAGLTDPEIAVLPGGHTSKRIDAALLLARDPDVLLLYWRRIDGERVYWREVEARLAQSDVIARHYEARAFLPSYGEDDAGYTVLAKRLDDR